MNEGENNVDSTESPANVTTGFGTKVWRLKELMAEVRSLAEEIKKEKRRKRKEKLRDSDSAGVHSIDRQMRKWRKKMQTKLHRITMKLKEVEQKVQEQGKELKKLAILHSFGKIDGHVKGEGTPTKMQQQQQQQQTLAPTKGGVNKVPIRRRGREGNSCSQHADCNPGNCCQRRPQHSEGEGQCVLFGNRVGDICEHSCACEAQLHCFRDKRVVGAQPFCKKALATDLLNGNYENGERSIFRAPQK